MWRIKEENLVGRQYISFNDDLFLQSKYRFGTIKQKKII